MNACVYVCGCAALLPPHIYMFTHSGMSAIASKATYCLPAAVFGHCCALRFPFLLLLWGCQPFVSPQFSALDVLAGMMMKGAAKCDKHAE